MSFMKRVAAWVLLIIFMLPMLVACDEEQDPLMIMLESYFDFVREGNYGSAYSLITQSAQERITLPEFVSKHQNIYTGIAVDDIALKAQDLQPANEGYVQSIEITLKTSLGDIQWKEDCMLLREESQWKLDWTPGVMMHGLDWGDTVRVVSESAHRGEVLSQDATPWAVNDYAPTVYVQLPLTDETNAAFASRVAPILNMETDAVLEIIESERSIEDGIAILKSYPIDAMTDALDARIKDAGMRVDYEKYKAIRYYPQGNTLSHILGYMRDQREDELETLAKQGYSNYTRIGADGLEKQYELTLHGLDGQSLRVYDAGGAYKRTIIGYEATDGLDIELTINLPLQIHATEMLENLPASYSGGVAIVMDPKTGDVLAAAGYPDYDPNDFSFTISNALMAAYNDSSSNSPFLNRITQGQYPPGSTVKPFTAAAGISTGKFSSSYEFTGRIEENEWTPSGSWPYPPIRRKRGDYGDMDMMNAMAYSDNIYFANIALEIGWEALENYFSKTGFNESVPFDIPTAKSRLYVRESLSNRKLLADTGYGQGEMLCTPLQLAASFCAFANNGTAMRPRVVSALKRLEGNEYVVVEEYAPEAWKQSAIESDTLSSMRSMLKKVMTRGTGKNVSVDGLTLYGKTGTAQLDDSRSREIAWIVVFGENDEGYSRLALVMLEVPADEGAERYTIAEELLKPAMSEYASLRADILEDDDAGEEE